MTATDTALDLVRRWAARRDAAASPAAGMPPTVAELDDRAPFAQVAPECAQRFAQCECARPEHPGDPVHRCACDGTWSIGPGIPFAVHRYPGAGAEFTAGLSPLPPRSAP